MKNITFNGKPVRYCYFCDCLLANTNAKVCKHHSRIWDYALARARHYKQNHRGTMSPRDQDLIQEQILEDLCTYFRGMKDEITLEFVYAVMVTVAYPY
jgi:hypothetical protein